MKFKDEGTQIWWDNLPKDKRDAVTKAYKCYDEMRNTPLVDDLPDTVVTTIRNNRPLYETLKNAHHVFEKEYVLNVAAWCGLSCWTKMVKPLTAVVGSLQTNIKWLT